MNLFQSILDLFQDSGGGVSFTSLYSAVLRISLPVLALIVVIRCAKSLLGFRREPEVWGWLRLMDGNLLPITHWENVIGRKKSADIVLDFATVSKSHAVLTRHKDGSWTVTDVGSRGKVQVNGKTVETAPLEYGDTLSLGGLEMTLEPVSAREKQAQASKRTKAGKGVSPGLTLVLLTLFQVLAALELCLNLEAENTTTILTAFGLLIGIQWLLFIGQKLIKRSGFEVETLAFFLSAMGLAVIASSDASEMLKQIVAMGIGIVIFLFIGWALRDLERAQKVRYLAAAGGILLLVANLAFGTELYGAKNWIMIGSVSFQPSELVKICFIFVGASTLSRIVTKRNMVLFIVYSAFICGCLALMSDFGTALIFFVAFLVIAYLRSGSFAAIAFICAGVGFAGVLAIKFFPYIMNRFQTWGHIWQYADAGGFQQTRALMCIASGGLFGLGAGRGWLKYVFAADADLVFAFISEEWGLLVAAAIVFALAVLGLFVVRSATVGRSSFYTISACAAMSILTMQAILNVFGTVDFLPLTGVTFPFVSNGGSSMMASWGLLAFIKACDTRQNASFAVPLSARKGEMVNE